MVKKQLSQHSLIHSRGALFFITVLAIIVLVSVIDIREKYVLTKEKQQYAYTQQQEALSREAHLQETLKRLETPEGVEAALREKFPIVRPGEGMVVIVDTPLPETVTEETSGISRFFKSLFRIRRE